MDREIWYHLWRSCLVRGRRFFAWDGCCRRWAATADDQGRPHEVTVLTPPSAVTISQTFRISDHKCIFERILLSCSRFLSLSFCFFFERELNWWITWRVVTLRSSSEMYCNFLTLDRCADCLFAKILKTEAKHARITAKFNTICHSNSRSLVNFKWFMHMAFSIQLITGKYMFQ